METPETDGKVTQIIKIYLLMFRNLTTCLNTYRLQFKACSLAWQENVPHCSYHKDPKQTCMTVRMF